MLSGWAWSWKLLMSRGVACISHAHVWGVISLCFIAGSHYSTRTQQSNQKCDWLWEHAGCPTIFIGSCTLPTALSSLMCFLSLSASLWGSYPLSQTLMPSLSITNSLPSFESYVFHRVNFRVVDVPDSSGGAQVSSRVTADACTEVNFFLYPM